jgi:hypothetical protein
LAIHLECRDVDGYLVLVLVLCCAADQLTTHSDVAVRDELRVPASIGSSNLCEQDLMCHGSLCSDAGCAEVEVFPARR